MKAKKIIERVLKVMNILINLVMTYIAFACYCNYGTSGYMVSDDIYRIIWIVVMFVMVNAGDYCIRKMIRDF